MKRYRWPILFSVLVVFGGVIARHSLSRLEASRHFTFLAGRSRAETKVTKGYTSEIFYFEDDVPRWRSNIEAELKALGYYNLQLSTSADHWYLEPDMVVVYNAPLASSRSVPLAVGDQEAPWIRQSRLVVEVVISNSEPLWDKLLRKLGIAPGESGGP